MNEYGEDSNNIVPRYDALVYDSMQDEAVVLVLLMVGTQKRPHDNGILLAMAGSPAFEHCMSFERTAGISCAIGRWKYSHSSEFRSYWCFESKRWVSMRFSEMLGRSYQLESRTV